MLFTDHRLRHFGLTRSDDHSVFGAESGGLLSQLNRLPRRTSSGADDQGDGELVVVESFTSSLDNGVAFRVTEVDGCSGPTSSSRSAHAMRGFRTEQTLVPSPMEPRETSPTVERTEPCQLGWPARRRKVNWRTSGLSDADRMLLERRDVEVLRVGEEEGVEGSVHAVREGLAEGCKVSSDVWRMSSGQRRRVDGGRARGGSLLVAYR